MTNDQFRDHCRAVAVYAAGILPPEYLREFGPPVMAQWDCAARRFTLHYAALPAAEAALPPADPDQGPECRADLLA